MRVLVTGGAGFIGSHVIESLHTDGVAVAALDDLSTGRRTNLPPDVRLYEVDVRDRESVRAAFDDFRPDVVSHHAAQASVKISVDSPALDAEINVIGGLNVLEEAVASGVERFVFASTGGAIYGEVPEGQAATEEWPARPMSPYAVSKAAFEGYARAYESTSDLRVTTLRYANVYGPRQDPHGEAGVVAIFAERVLRQQPVRLNARATAGDDGCVRDYVFVGDVVEANRLAMAGELNGVFNVGTGRGRTTRNVLDAVIAAAGTAPHVDPGPPRPGDLEVSVLSSAKLRAFGWEPQTTFVAGIATTVDWVRSRL